MDRLCAVTSFTLLFMLTLLSSSVAAATAVSDVEALHDLYKSLDSPPQLVGWKSEGGDPCEESWTGISCDGASIVNITLPGLGLEGYLSRQLNLSNLKKLVLSFNHIQGEIPDPLPPSLTYIDLSSNKLCTSLPPSLAVMKHLHYLNLSHNFLSGTVSNLFTDLQQLKIMDLSHNSFTGDLPSSFENLTSLTGLFLQNNKFTGSVNSLENLPLLIELNLQNNNLSGVSPKKLLHMANLGILGEAFQDGAQKAPGDTPTISSAENENTPLSTQLSPTESYLLLGIVGNRRKRVIAVGTAFGIVILAFVAICAAVSITTDLNESRVNKAQDPESGSTVLPSSTDNGTPSITTDLNESRVIKSQDSESPSSVSPSGTNNELAENQAVQSQIEPTTTSTVLLNVEELDNCREVYVELRNSIPYYLACLTILFPITIPCGLFWIFVALMTVCLALFLWLGGEAFFHIQKIRKKNGENSARLAAFLLWCQASGKTNEDRETGAPLLEKSKSCKNGSGWKVVGVTAFAVSYTLLLTIFIVCKPCTN